MGVNEFLDGYAWLSTNRENDKNYKIYYNNCLYTYYTVDGLGIKPLKRPNCIVKYYFFSKILWDDNMNPIPIRIDSLKSNIVINYDDNFKQFETNLIQILDSVIRSDSCYDEGSDPMILFCNRDDIFCIGNGGNPSPTNYTEFKRVINPPKFVQDFIKDLKKKSLSKTSKPQTYIYNSNYQKINVIIPLEDTIEILRKEGEWIRIRYYGSSTVEGYIKKNDIE